MRFGGVLACSVLVCVACSSSGLDATTAAASCDRLFEAESGVLVAHFSRPVYPSPGLDLTAPVDCRSAAPDALRARIKARFEKHCVEQVTACGSGVTGAWLDACSDALAQVSCGGGVPDACADAPSGRLHQGDGCSAGFQCASLFCDQGKCGNATDVGGACGVSGGGLGCFFLGSPCAWGSTCVAADGCNGVCKTIDQNASHVGGACDDARGPHCAAGATCEQGTCRTAACTGTSSCLSGQCSCGAGLTCDATGHCATPSGQGATCHGSSECAAGLYCSGLQAGTCQPVVPLGAVCTAPSSCGAPGATCDATGHCVAVEARDAWPGEGCSNATQVRCVLGACPGDAVSGGPATCPAAADIGEACGGGSTCEPYGTCVDGTCRWSAFAGCGQ